MSRFRVPLGEGIELELPPGTEELRMAGARALADPAAAIRAALESPIASPPFAAVARDRLSRAEARGAGGPPPRAAIVVSDSTRPVPYRDEGGILWPLVETLLAEGWRPGQLLVLVATGTHRGMGEAELRAMIDPRVFGLGVEVRNHDCRDESRLVRRGSTARGGEIWVNRDYVGADLKIATGLVESHFMAGASGGRKSICPGLVGERSTFVFHGAPMMAHPGSRDLVLEGNPCHEEALETAKAAGCDFILNVTLDQDFRVAGVFAGGLEEAHAAAVARLRDCVGVPFSGEYDIVVTHAGYVGQNHYQAAKAAVAAAPLLAPHGHLVMVADNRDLDPVGSIRYKTVLQLLALAGPEAVQRLLRSPDWPFIPEQWQVQMWCRAFSRFPMGHFAYFAPQLDDRHWEGLPGLDGRRFLPPERRAAPGLADAPAFVAGAVAAAIADLPPARREAPRIAWLAEGPYGIPIKEGT